MQRKIFLLLIVSVSLMIFTATALAQQKFIGHLNNIQEVPTNNSTATGVCYVTLNLTETQMTVNATCTEFNVVGSCRTYSRHGTGRC